MPKRKHPKYQRARVYWSKLTREYADVTALDVARIEATVGLAQFAPTRVDRNGDAVSQVAVGPLTVWFYDRGDHRRIVAVDGGPQVCRTDKRAFGSEAEALSYHRHLEGLPGYSAEVEPYLCVCGRWHLGNSTAADRARDLIRGQGDS